MDLSHRNYFRGYGVLEKWRVEIDRCQRPPLSYFEEACINAELIWEHSNGHIYVLFSGGMDSMFVVQMLRHMKMKFTPVIIRFNDDYNFEDVDWACNFCKDINAVPIILDLDYDKFIESGTMYELAMQYECATSQLSHIFWAVKQLCGSVVMGECPPNILHREESNSFVFEVPRYDFSPPLFWKQNGIGGTPFFLTYTAESLLAFMTDPTLAPFLSREVDNKTLDNFKVNIYNNQPYFKIPFRTKQSGFEFFEKTPAALHSDVVQADLLYRVWGGRHCRDYRAAVSDMLPL
jgi:hypothetical protein